MGQQSDAAQNPARNSVAVRISEDGVVSVDLPTDFDKDNVPTYITFACALVVLLTQDEAFPKEVARRYVEFVRQRRGEYDKAAAV